MLFFNLNFYLYLNWYLSTSLRQYRDSVIYLKLLFFDCLYLRWSFFQEGKGINFSFLLSGNLTTVRCLEFSHQSLCQRKPKMWLLQVNSKDRFKTMSRNRNPGVLKDRFSNRTVIRQLETTSNTSVCCTLENHNT